MGRLATLFFGPEALLPESAMIEIMLVCAGALLALMVILWLVSLRLNDVSFIDAFWAFGFVLVAGLAYASGPGHSISALLLVLTAIWGVRLGTHLFLRWRSHGADPRYVAMIDRSTMDKRLYTLVYIFLLQGLLLWLISLPLQLAASSEPVPQRFWLAGIGIALWLVGFLFETIGDAQLARFRADPASAGKVLDRGLWRYTRHPNYFGDACLWWGLYLIASATLAGAWAFFAPLIMTGLLLKLSGVPMLERHLAKTRPGYADYIARTSAFLPWPPRRHFP
jgi:steroid 5-alpha reductase family enzyme